MRCVASRSFASTCFANRPHHRFCPSVTGFPSGQYLSSQPLAPKSVQTLETPQPPTGIFQRGPLPSPSPSCGSGLIRTVSVDDGSWLQVTWLPSSAISSLLQPSTTRAVVQIRSLREWLSSDLAEQTARWPPSPFQSFSQTPGVILELYLPTWSSTSLSLSHQ